MRRSGLSKWALLALVFATAVIADQATKFLAVDRLTLAFQRQGAATVPEKARVFYSLRYLEGLAKAPYTVWKPVWRMNYVENPGAAWGLGRGMSETTRNGFFMLVSVAAVGFILYYYRRLSDRQRYMQIALALVLSGAVGNFIDRLARRYVIDFVEWHWWNRPDLRWPTFNVADSLIVIGVALLMLHPGQKKRSPVAVELGGNRKAAPRL
jgi:signal peptidase II